MESDAPHSDNDTAREDLKRACRDLVQEINELHLLVKDEYKPQSVDAEEPEQSVKALKKQCLIAETETIRNTEIKALSTNRAVLQDLLEEDLKQSVKELEVTLACVKAEERQIDQEIERQKTEEQQYNDIDAVLRQKLEEAQMKEEKSEERIVSDLKKKYAKARKYEVKLMEELAQFINEHFPAPRQRNLSGPSDDDEERTEPYQPMLTLVENLMNKCVDSPADPYVQLGPQCWQPHVELLLRHNIALKHPDDDNRIKLVPFHL